MSNKRKNRNNKKVLQALRQKRANGGRLNKRRGGPSEEDIERMIAQQSGNQTASTNQTAQADNQTASTNQTAQADNQTASTDQTIGLANQQQAESSESEPYIPPKPTKPSRGSYGGSIGGQTAYKNDLAAYEQELAAWNSVYGSGETPTSSNDQSEESVSIVDAATRADRTGQRVEDTAYGDPDTLAALAPQPDVAKTGEEKVGGYDAQGNPILIDPLQTRDTDVQTISDRTATTKPADVVADEFDAETVTTTAQGTTPTEFGASTYTAAGVGTLGSTTAATGSVSKEAEATDATMTASAEAAERDTAQEAAAMAEEQDFDISDGAYVNKVTGEITTVAPTTEAEAKQREAITGKPAEDGQAAQIIGTVGYEAAQRRTVKGEAAKGAAASMIAEVGDLPPTITAAIVEDPATVEAQIDDQPVEVRAAIAALPTEALVSSQMETLLGGMEDGKTPAWARPAVAAIEANLAQRGLSASTVGRDALFNAIIQSALTHRSEQRTGPTATCCTEPKQSATG